MINILLLFCFLLNKLSISQLSPKSDILSKLQSIQQQINSETTPICYGTGHSASKQSFIQHKYSKYIGDLPVLIYPFCLVTHELGNRLGNYFSEVTCAEASGMHFVAVHKQFDITGSHNGNYSVKNSTSVPDAQKLAFLNALPTIIPHKSPLERSSAVKKIQEECKCTRYCWTVPGTPWVNRTATIGTIIRTAVDAYRNSLTNKAMGTEITETDFSNSKKDQLLPLIPDVAIQYRCGDNIAFNYQYGILPFTAFESRIPKNPRTIYVLSDHPTRAVHSPYTSRCQLIIQSLFDYLQEKYPQTIIVAKRGGDLFLDYVRLTYANTTICSASSYCFWPAISNPGVVHFPVTSLIAGADSIELAPDFGSRFNWINEPKIISNFKNYRPWTNIINVLTGKTPPNN